MLFKEGYSSLSRKPSVESPDECGSTLFTSANRIVHQNGHNSFHCINTDSNLSMESSQSSTSILDIHKGKPIRLQVKVLVPVQDHPNFNFVGKLLGPKGNSLKWLQEETLTKMAILGKGSMRDKEKEEELRKTGDAKYSHLNEELHVDITAFAPAPEAYSRIGHALHEVKRFLVPDYYDDIRQQQLRELGVLSTDKKPANISRVRGEPIKGESSLNGFLRPAAGPNFSTTTESSPLELSEVNGRPLRPFSGFNQKPKYCPHSNFQISHINEENHPDSNGSWNNNKIMSRINRDNFRSVRPYPKTFIHNYP